MINWLVIWTHLKNISQIDFGSFKSWTQIAFGPLTFAKTLGKNSSSHPVAQGPQGVCDTEI